MKLEKHIEHDEERFETLRKKMARIEGLAWYVSISLTIQTGKTIILALLGVS